MKEIKKEIVTEITPEQLIKVFKYLLKEVEVQQLRAQTAERFIIDMKWWEYFLFFGKRIRYLKWLLKQLEIE